jgi:hypothetical protein
MLRPISRLTESTREGLDAAVRRGAHETWVDRSELGLAEPSALWRWLCVLELTAPRASAVGCSADDSENGPELAAREALARLDEFARAHRNANSPAQPIPQVPTASREASIDPDPDVRPVGEGRWQTSLRVAFSALADGKYPSSRCLKPASHWPGIAVISTREVRTP